jgi:adenylate cyclase
MMSRLAGSHVELVRERLDETGSTGTSDASSAKPAPGIAADVEWLLGCAWRRHMGVAMGSLQAQQSRSAPAILGVGFADIVGFTELSSGLSDAELTHVIERFEGRTADSVTMHGGSVVKMLGDELLFVAHEANTIADIAIHLVEAFQADRDVPGVRIGVTMGPVVRHLGDVFGTTVNLASRLTTTAAPNTILTADELAATLIEHDDYELQHLGHRNLRGLGQRRVFRLDRRNN